VVETDNDLISQHDEQGKLCPSPPSATFQLQCYIEAGDQNKDQTTETTGGNILEQALLLTWDHPHPQPPSSPTIISGATSTEDRGQKRRQSGDSIQAGTDGKQRKTSDYSASPSITAINTSTATTPTKSSQANRLKDWRRKRGEEIEETEKLLEEISAEIEFDELEVTKLNNVLAGRKGKMTFSDREHTFSLQTEKDLMKSKIDSLSEELKTKRTMRTQNKKIYLGLLQNLSATKKEYLKFVQAEKEEVKTVIGLTPFIAFNFIN